jgi:hypothetical protein
MSCVYMFFSTGISGTVLGRFLLQTGAILLRLLVATIIISPCSASTLVYAMATFNQSCIKNTAFELKMQLHSNELWHSRDVIVSDLVHLDAMKTFLISKYCFSCRPRFSHSVPLCPGTVIQSSRQFNAFKMYFPSVTQNLREYIHTFL